MTFTLLVPELAQRFAGTLLQFIWQGGVIALVTAMVLWMMRRDSAERRYAVGIAGLALMLVAPVMTFAFYEQAGAVALMLLQASSLVSGSVIFTALPSDARAWTEGILLAWCTGVCALLARVATGWYLSRRLVRSADGVIPESLQQLFEVVQDRLAVTRAVRLLIHARIDSPIVVGWLRPIVLLPLSALTSLSGEHMLAVFAHELAHIRRHDFVVNMLQRCVEAILFYHPAVWWLSNRVRRERENCCDDLAVRVCGNSKRYAEALLRLERERGALPVVAVPATGSGTLERVRRILGIEPSEADWRAAVVAPLIVIVWLSTGFVRPPTVQALEIAPVPSQLSVEHSASSDVKADVIADQPAPPRSTPLRTLAAIIAAPPAPVVTADVPAEPQTPNTGASAPSAGAAGTQPGSSPKPGQMQGTVVDAAGKPVSGAEVRLTPLTGGMQPGGPAYTTVTDENGAFTLESIRPAPRLGLTARKTGYQVFRYGSTSQASPTVPIPIAEGESLTGLALVMEQEGVLTGRVVTAEGAPIPAAIVVATNTTAARTLPITATTNERGEFRITGLRPGSYYLAAQNLLGSLGAAASMTTSMTTYYPGVTDRSAATALDVTDGQQTTGLEIRIQQAKGYMVRGTLTPAPSGGTTLISASPNQAQANPLAALNATGAILDPGGSFAIGPLAPGEYQVRATSISGGKTSIVGTAVVNVVNADLAGVTLAPLRTFTVTGKASLEDGTVEQLLASVSAARPGFGGRGGRGGAAPNAGVGLALTPKEIGGSATAMHATIGPDGTFTFENVQPGLYTLGSPIFIATYLKSFMWNGQDVSSSQLKIESGGEITLTYRRGAVRVTGNATDAEGKPVAGATALIWPVAPRPARASDGAFASSIDATGAFAMPAIAPGLYYAAAFPGINGVTALQLRFYTQFNDRATMFEVHENTPVTLDIRAVTPEMVNEALKKPQ
jgi:beta-lactamase regulating signal transducer with metallopeptidase domain/protocatechuate 3,4-dioxygenase beta subunit